MNKVTVRSLIVFLFVGVLVTGFLYYQNYQCTQRAKHHETNFNILHNELRSSSSCIRSAAALDLQKTARKLGINVKIAVPRLLELLKDEEPSVRWRSIAALGYIGYFTDEVKSSIFEMIKDENPITRINTIFAVSQIPVEQSSDGSERTIRFSYQYSPQELEFYLVALNDTDSSVIYKSLLHLTLYHLGSAPQEFIDRLANTLREIIKKDNEINRGLALVHLGMLLGLEKTEAEIPDFQIQLLSFSNHENQYVSKGSSIMRETISKGLDIKVQDMTVYQDQEPEAKSNMLDIQSATKSYRELCHKEKKRSSCNRMISIVRGFPIEQQKVFLRDQCDQFEEIRSCLAFAMLLHRDGDASQRDKYFERIYNYSTIKCQQGYDFEFCAGEVMMLCALGKNEEGRERRKVLCENEIQKCQRLPECDNMLQGLDRDFR